ncbi:MAG TPA: zinc-ribbon domain-containing protein [Opitutaceae bacterium]|nr:zinc-ribbon domain-containing protein [Opitutaceae bacterium]
MPEKIPPPAECANCGAPIPRGAKACPECGADEHTGWRETGAPDYAALDLPEEIFADEAASDTRRARDRCVNGLAWYWWCAGVAIVVLLALRWLGLL